MQGLDTVLKTLPVFMTALTFKTRRVTARLFADTALFIFVVHCADTLCWPLNKGLLTRTRTGTRTHRQGHGHKEQGHGHGVQALWQGLSGLSGHLSGHLTGHLWTSPWRSQSRPRALLRARQRAGVTASRHGTGPLAGP